MSVVEASCLQTTKATIFHLLIHGELVFEAFEM